MAATQQEREQRVAAEQAVRQLQQKNQTLAQDNRTLQEQQTQLEQKNAYSQQQVQRLQTQLKTEQDPARSVAAVATIIKKAHEFAHKHSGKHGVTASKETDPGDWEPLAPFGETFSSSRVTCRWRPLAGVENYRLIVKRASDYHEISTPAPTRSTSVTVSVPLPASAELEPYFWQVEVRRRGQSKPLILEGGQFAMLNAQRFLENSSHASGRTHSPAGSSK